MSKSIIAKLRKDLVSNADPATKAGSDRFFKKGEEPTVYGVKNVLVKKLSMQYFAEIKTLPKEEIFNLCEELWKSDWLEESFIACNWSYYLNDRYTPEDFQVFEHWLHSYVTNWGDCDTLCNHTVGDFVMLYPEYTEKVAWTGSANRWVKRGAAVTFIIPARKGLFHETAFEIADILLMDTDDLVRKGYGWMLKAVSEHSAESQKRVFDYIIKHKATMPRTSLRYAIEKMPPEMRKEAMAK